MLCKTIVFAMTKKHALRLKDAFYDVFPQYVDMAKVNKLITRNVYQVHPGLKKAKTETLLRLIRPTQTKVESVMHTFQNLIYHHVRTFV